MQGTDPVREVLDPVDRHAILDWLVNASSDPARVVVDAFLAGATIHELCETYDFHHSLVEGIIRLALKQRRCL